MKDFVDLLRQAKNGDENAILEYIDRFKPLLKKYANRLRQYRTEKSARYRQV